jgi:F1F0 ATPase subunit 2
MIFTFFAGLLIGSLYFWGLWQTTRRITMTSHPTLLFLTSFIVRLLILMQVVFWAAGGSWQRLMVCSAGIILARMISIPTTNFLRKSDPGQ